MQPLLSVTRAAADPTNDPSSEGTALQTAQRASLPNDLLQLLKIYPNRADH